MKARPTLWLRRTLPLVTLTLMATCARAGISVLVEQPYGKMMTTLNPTGHSAVYLDHVCAASLTRLRPCRPGELGVVISRYDGINSSDWLAVPLVPYLYAVNTPEEIPTSITRIRETELRDIYRRASLRDIAADTTAGAAPGSNWYELIGSAYDRTIYGFSVTTTPEQDARLIALYNDRPNRERYNGAFTNCADFTRVFINRIFPHAIRRNFIGDLGITTPKSVARSFARYANKRPELDLHVFVIPQVPGDIPRSSRVEGVTGSLVKRYGLPIAVLSPATAAIVLAAYIGEDRFPMPAHAPTLDLRPHATEPTSPAFTDDPALPEH